jgi:hypothetical protein
MIPHFTEWNFRICSEAQAAFARFARNRLRTGARLIAFITRSPENALMLTAVEGLTDGPALVRPVNGSPITRLNRYRPASPRFAQDRLAKRGALIASTRGRPKSLGERNLGAL